MVIAFVSIIRDLWGGSEELWAACAKEALLSGHRVIISAYDCGKVSPKTQYLIDNNATLLTRIGTILEKSSSFSYFQKRLRRIYYKTIGNPFSKIFEYNPDIVVYIGTGFSITNDSKLLRLITQKKATFFINIQLASEFESTPSQKEIFTTKRAFNLCRQIYFVSNRNKVVTESHLKQILNNATVVRNPVNISSTSIMPYPKSDSIQLAMVGNLRTVHKGQDIALQVLSQPQWQERNWHLNIYGSGEDEGYLKQLVGHLQLENKVTFHGKVSDIRAVWEKNHLLLMPSHMEGMPLAVVEAMICGRPCVGTDVGGIAEWIEEGESGFIAEAPTVSSFGASVEKAWGRLNDWESIGRKAHERAMSLYDPEPGKTLLKLITQ